MTYRPLSEVRNDIYTELKQQRSQVWMDQANKESRPQFSNPAFLGTPPPPNKAK